MILSFRLGNMQRWRCQNLDRARKEDNFFSNFIQIRSICRKKINRLKVCKSSPHQRTERSPNLSCKIVRDMTPNCLRNLQGCVPCTRVASICPSTPSARYARRCLALQLRPRPKKMAHEISILAISQRFEAVLTTVKSSNGLASSMFFNVASRLFNSASTFPFVSSALFMAWVSNTSMALICFPTSYVTGLNFLK